MKAKNLSKGERRRLSIAEEIVHGPHLLLIDEPTTNLDLHDTSVMMQTFREMVNQDRTVVATLQNVRSYSNNPPLDFPTNSLFFCIFSAICCSFQFV